MPLRLAAGPARHGDLLKALDTGLYVSNLWYLNYSDRAAGRMTGMTRYACFWVERGELVAPVDVMRFDDDACACSGRASWALTDRTEVVPNSDTYGARQLGLGDDAGRAGGRLPARAVIRAPRRSP